MYCNKENINQLTALLVSHGVKHAVVCPGSRNAPIVHNLNACPNITCWGVTDERSAGFFALGLRQSTGSKVAVCVTSGSAMLNLSPALIEADYQYHGLIVITADRPEAWIGQNDGQTMPQPGAFGQIVAASVNIIEPQNDEQRWLNNRLLNEVLMINAGKGEPSVHINVPISEPLFDFSVPELPEERVINRPKQTVISQKSEGIMQRLMEAERPIFVVGQMTSVPLWLPLKLADATVGAVVLSECIGAMAQIPIEKTLKLIEKSQDVESFRPDLVIYCGGTLVSKRLKRFLRACDEAEFWELSPDGKPHDTFQKLSVLLSDDDILPIVQALSAKRNAADFVSKWYEKITQAQTFTRQFVPDYSQMLAVQMFENQLSSQYKKPFAVHYANSNAVRLGNIYATRHSFCNRGINGIEGSLSTSAGFSAAFDGTTFCVCGDLSFFYDANSLWNNHLNGRFRVLLLNNSCGAIFRSLPGLEASDAAKTFVSGAHNTSARGICESYHAKYLHASNAEELQMAMSEFINVDSERPVVLEVFTDADQDNHAFEDYLK